MKTDKLIYGDRNSNKLKNNFNKKYKFNMIYHVDLL